MIDLIRLTHAALRDGQPRRAGQMSVLPVAGGSPRLRLGLDAAGLQHLLLETQSPGPVTTGVAAINASLRTFTIEGRSTDHIDVICVDPELVEVFDHFTASVFERSHDEDVDLHAVILNALEDWRALFSVGGPPPSVERLTGLFGELLLLRDVARLDAREVPDVWTGPRGGRHDLRRGTTAIEVKATRAHTAYQVSIHGVDQLEPPSGGTLHLHLVRVEEVTDGDLNIPVLVEELINLGVSRHALLGALAAAGVSPGGLIAAEGVRFDVRERRTFAVDERFPRIVADSFHGGRVPAEVLDLSYRLDLSGLLDHALDDEAESELVGRLCPRGDR